MYFSKDSACQELNLKHRCYILDHFCQPNANRESDDNLVTPIIIGLIVLSILVVCCVLLCYLQKRRKERKGMLNNVYVDKCSQKVNM